ncbi:Sterigmatocystin 8-O-methyltransferase, partial [Termitomyces sp. T112]
AVNSGDMTVVPFSRAFNTKESFWEVLSREEFRYRRFNIAMEGVRAMQPSDAILKAYDWSELPTESIIIDVGGGVGSESLILAREFPSFNFVVQDLALVIEAAKIHWQQDLPNAQVTFEIQDFFMPQPAGRHVTVFLLKQILHDWSDKDCIKILTQLRAAAETDTKLLLIESILLLACHDPNNDVDTLDFPGSTVSEAPAPLLANFGIVNVLGYTADLNMFLLFDAQERTIRHFNQLLRSTGWKIKKVYRQDGGDSTFLQSVEAIPV